MPKKTTWDNFAQGYDKIVGNTGNINHKTYLNPLVLKLLGNIKNKKVLDLACGNGYFSRILAKKKAIVTGVDYSKDLISIANSKNSNNSVNFFVGSSSNMSFLKNNSFDFIVCNISFHDIKDIPKTINECSRVIKNKGKLIFSIPHPVFNLTEEIRKENKYFRQIGNYMSILELDNHFGLKGLKCYHRPIEYYMKNLFKNKFMVSGFYEISKKSSDRKEKRFQEKIYLDFKKEMPAFLIIEATCVK